jgi:predicted metal-binding protein
MKYVYANLNPHFIVRVSVKNSKSIHSIEPPVSQAMVFICEKCGKRAKGSDKNPSHRLASKFKRLAKDEFGKGSVRIALTSCMDICPDDQIAISIQPTALQCTSSFVVSDVDDLDASSDALVKTLRFLLAGAPV